jgi:hypothetical protein
VYLTDAKLQTNGMRSVPYTVRGEYREPNKITLMVDKNGEQQISVLAVWYGACLPSWETKRFPAAT